MRARTRRGEDRLRARRHCRRARAVLQEEETVTLETVVAHSASIATTLLLGVALAMPGSATAHGTSDPGPHGGEIRMPGAFHVEAVARDDALRIYVLDMQFENPTAEAASIEARLDQAGREIPLDCEASTEIKAFTCPLPDNARLDNGKLVIEATRKGKPAEPARYDLPLKWSNR